MISTTIKKSAFEEKMKDLERRGFFIEYKARVRHWVVRLERFVDCCNRLPIEAVFLVGGSLEPERFEAFAVAVIPPAVVPERYAVFLAEHPAPCYYAIKCRGLEA